MGSRAGAPHVLLIWPGTDGAAAGNFGVPQLVGLATYVRAKTGAHVDVIDLATERALGPVSLPRLFAGPEGRGYDLVGFSCYASFDWLKVHALATLARKALPDALICAGGYHASARPAEVLGDASVFDAVVIGEGEKPLTQLVESVAGGAPIRGAILGPDPILDLDAELPPTDWTFLDRYRAVARRTASQAQLYLSRGCPFDCAFCMERAKREVSWRSFSVERAMEEAKRLDEWLDLSSWTLYIADALFGMRGGWRKAFLDRLAASPLRARKLWLLIRVDMVDEEDLQLFGAANCGLGFGLESGDPRMLATARKAGRLDTYLDRMRDVARHARELDVPWGANVICGHPGETEESMRTSAAYLRELFLDDPAGTTGFLSVDPFRFYPGSPIDGERAAVEAEHGTVFHRPDWWNDGDPEFLSEWVDPSRELDYRARAALQHELLGPLLRALPERFVYRGPARDYFRRAIDDQIAADGAGMRLHFAERHYAWRRYLGRTAAATAQLERDLELAAVCARHRETALPAVLATAGVDPHTPDGRALAEALVRVPRERFVPLDCIAASVRDEAIALDASGAATCSAMHAYARSFAAAGIGEGSLVLDLGAGTGYGAALLARLVGAGGAVRAVELDPRLARLAAVLVQASPHVTVVTCDALDPDSWAGESARFDRAVLGFAVAAFPAALEAVLTDDAIVVAPVGPAGGPQELVRFRRRAGRWEAEQLGPTLYVPARTRADVPADPPARRPAGDTDTPTAEARAARPRRRVLAITR